MSNTKYHAYFIPQNKPSVTNINDILSKIDTYHNTKCTQRNQQITTNILYNEWNEINIYKSYNTLDDYLQSLVLVKFTNLNNIFITDF